MSTTGARPGLSRAAAQLTDEHISGNRVPRRPFVDILEASGVGQFSHGLIGCIREPCLTQQVDYFLPAVLHQNNLLAEAERLRLTLERLRLPSRSRRRAQDAGQHLVGPGGEERDQCDRQLHQVELMPGGQALLEPARQLLRDLAAAVGAARSASGELAATLHKQLGTITDLTAADAALRELHGAYEALHAQFALPQGLTVLPVNANGVACLRLAPETEPPATVVYLHGGCYSAGSAFGYRHLAGALAVAADRSVLVPEYRLAPEHAFPAAVEDTVRSYLWLLDQDIPPSAVTIVGDSSGAHLALSLLLVARREDLPLPGAAVGKFLPPLGLPCSALRGGRTR
jgi:hypothetical protein